MSFKSIPSPPSLISTSPSPQVVRLLQIEPTTRCNFTCGFCVGRRLDQNDITMGTFRHALALFPDIERLELHGEGEPLMHPDYFEMARLANLRGIKISTITNGSMFSPERIKRILDSGIDTVLVSIESPRPEDFKEIRGGSLFKVVAGIKALLAARKARGQSHPTVGFGVTVLKRTQSLMPEIAQLYSDLEMDGGISAHMLNSMPGYTGYYQPGMPEQVLSTVEQGLAWARYAKVIQSPEYQRSSPAVHFSDQIFGQNDPDIKSGPSKSRLAKDYRSCPWLDKGLYINRHGHAAGCARIKDTSRFGFGDVTRDSPAAILEQRERLGESIRAGNIPEACAGCFIATTIENRLARLKDKRPCAIRASVTEEAWLHSMQNHVIGSIPYDGASVAAILSCADGRRTTEELIAHLGQTWNLPQPHASMRVLPILNELLRMEAISV